MKILDCRFSDATDHEFANPAGSHEAVCAACVLEEADESLFWLEPLVESGVVAHEKLGSLLKESDELVSIFVASLRTVKGIGDHTAPNARTTFNLKSSI